MRLGFVGLGKLGLPVSIAMENQGHFVWGYEIDEGKRQSYREGKANLYEPNIDHHLKTALDGGLKLCDTLEEMIDAEPQIIFVAVPTPSRDDDSFDTSYLIKATEDIGKTMRGKNFHTTMAIISTILPQTMRNEVLPALEEFSEKRVGTDIDLCYNASFIAMGTTIRDFLNPEFVLIGESVPLSEGGSILENFYRGFLKKPVFRMTWENAELVKMCYNTYIGFKIIYGNNLMEMCHKIPHADCDVIIHTLSHATDRIISPSYLRGGMADGGECHPRDNLALSWLAEQLELSSNMFSFVMETRRAQAEWLAKLLASYDLPIIILGARYKPNTNLTSESGSLLVADILRGMGKDVSIYDPDIGLEVELQTKAVYLIGHMFDFIKSMRFERGSIVIDPWSWLGDCGEATYISVGRKNV